MAITPSGADATTVGTNARRERISAGPFRDTVFEPVANEDLVSSLHNRAPHYSEDATALGQISTGQRFNPPVAPRFVPPEAETSLKVIGRWEGVILSVGDDTFVARVRDPLRTIPEHEAEF